MAHLQKKSSGHLAKASSGHLKLHAPCADCPTTVFADNPAACGAGCNGTYQFDYDGGCFWPQTSGPCNASGPSYEPALGKWEMLLPYPGDWCYFYKTGVASDCPTGTWTEDTSESGACGDCPTDINVYT